MRLRLFHKLFFAIVLASFGSIVLFGLTTHWVMQRSFVRYLNEARDARLEELAALLARRYATDGGWARLTADRRAWHRLLHNSDDAPRAPPELAEEQDGAGVPPGPPREELAPRRPPPHPGSRAPVTLYDAAHELVAGRLPYAEDMQARPITVAGSIVGWVAMPPLAERLEGRDRRFERRQVQVLLIGAGIAALLSIIVAWLTARRLAAPIRTVGEAAHELARGRFETRLPRGTRDELGQLFDDFNVLARALHENESARRRWFADISHELRTPLAIMHGELEAARDGIRPNDGRLIESLGAETERLRRLIDDLYQLARADIGTLDFEFQVQPLAPLVEQAAARFAHRFAALGLACNTDIDAAVQAQVDRERLDQLLDNVLENCCRYVAAPGTVSISLRRDAAHAVIAVADSGPGVSAHDLPHLFEPLHRGEASRNRGRGGSGLGLAICQRIAHAHGGHIEAKTAAGGGLTIELELPLEAPA